MQHCIYGVRRDGKLLVPREFVRHLAGTLHKGVSAEQHLREFESATGINLNLSEYRWIDKQARTIDPELSPELIQAHNAEIKTPAAQKTDKVNFVTGERRTHRKHRQAVHEYDAYLQELALDAAKGHPARELVELLNNQPIAVHEKQYARTMDAAKDCANITLSGERRDYALTTITAIEDCAATRYKPSRTGRTCRIFAVGQSLNSLPRGVRKIVLGGCDHYDLRAAQLAIAARNWGLPQLTGFLSTGSSIWALLASHCQVPLSYKPILKTTIYSVCYGMGMTKLKSQLADGDDKDPGIGAEAAERFFTHNLIKELLAGRKIQLSAINTDGGAVDAFGQWIPIPWISKDKGKPKPAPQSVLAQVAQSHELHIMIQILSILQSNRSRIRILSWLHDGIYLRYTDATKAERWHRQITSTIDSYCRLHGYRTELEHEYLPEIWASPEYDDLAA